MTLMIKQSTATTLMIGPFIESVSGVAVKNDLSIPASGVVISKNGGDFAAKNDTTAPATKSYGYYTCVLNTTDTNTLGRFTLTVNAAGALPVFHEYSVVRADVYDTMYGTDYFQVDMVQINGQLTNGNNAVLSLKQLNIANSDGHAIYADTSGGNGCGIYAYGNGTGSGIKAIGGASSGNGIMGQAGSGGADIKGNLVGNITGNVSGTLTTVTTVSDASSVATAVWDKDISGYAASGSTAGAFVSNILRWFRNKRTVTNSEQKLFADNGTTVVYTQTLGDDGTTSTRGGAT